MNKKIVIVIVIVVLAIAGVVYWHAASKKPAVQTAEQSQPVQQAPQPAPQVLSANTSINGALENIIGAQGLTTLNGLDCSKISDQQFIAVGDGVMGALAGDETHHSAMENMMGGETGNMTNAAHTHLGQLYLNCPQVMMQSDATGTMASSTAMGENMKNSQGAMSGKMAMHGSMAMVDLDVLAIKSLPGIGEYVTDSQGKTLYTFANDTAGVSNCSGQCLVNWPAYIVSKQAAASIPTYYQNLSVITRSDGSLQLAYKGMPLYYFAKDTMPGDALGQGVGGLWQVVKL